MKSFARIFLDKWRWVALFALLLACILFFFSIKNTAAVVWTQQSSIDGNWIDIDSSYDGTKLVAANNGGYIYTSTNSGVTWTERTASGSRQWLGVTSSSDGTKLAAVNYGGYVYTSTDSGATWTERVSSGTRDWYSIASSSDGTKLAAAVQSGYVYTSTDAGATWSERSGVGANTWYDIASSADGTKLAVINQSAQVGISTDAGATWSVNEAYNTSCVGAKSITSSSDGTKLALAGCNGGAETNHYVYTSTDSGTTWVPRTGSTSKYWYAISSSDDGSVLLAANITDSPYLSIDGGATWEEQTSAGSATWVSSSVSGNGSVLAAGIYGGKIYTAGLILDSTAPTIAEVTPVVTPTTDSTPNYTFNTNEAGTISYGGSCSSVTTSASIGSNTITFNTLADGTYSNCTITVTDAASNASTPLAVTAFVIDTTSPVVAETAAIQPAPDTTPDYAFTSSEAGTIVYGGDCSSSATTATSGINTITFNTLTSGPHNNCTITVTDSLAHVSNILAVSSFQIVVHGSGGGSATNTTNNPSTAQATSTNNQNNNLGIKDTASDNIADAQKNTQEQIIQNCGTISDSPYIMKIGTIHPTVKILQKLLNCKGYVLADSGAGSPGKETNIFGSRTYAAVIKFQKDNNLILREGVVGPETRNSLNK